MALTAENDVRYMLTKYKMESEAIYSASVLISLWLLQDLVAKQMFLTCCKFCCGMWCKLTHPLVFYINIASGAILFHQPRQNC
jgi:hypothetical protein